MPKSCRHVPIDKTYIITSGILPHFLKRHPLSLKGAMIFACKEIRRQLPAFNFQKAYALEYFFCGQHLLRCWMLDVGCRSSKFGVRSSKIGPPTSAIYHGTFTAF